MHISQFNKPNPRNLTGGDGYTVDLGMVSLRDAAIYGRTRPLIPYADGRLIKSVRFVPGGVFTAENDVNFNTPNAKMAAISSGGSFDTLGIIYSGDQTDILGSNGSSSQIIDSGPLCLGLGEFRFLSNTPWTANTPVCIEDFTVQGDYIYECSTNGVTGGTIPVFDAGPVTDGTVVWTRYILTPTGEVHVIAEVIEGVSPGPPFPSSLEWVQQPTETVAGAPIDDIIVLVKDQNGDPYVFEDMTASLKILGVGTLTGEDASIDKSTGLLTFSGFSIAAAGTYILRTTLAFCIVADPIFSDPFEITAP